MRVNYIDCCDSITGLRGLPDNCVDCCVTSPPYYGLRDYGVDGQIGVEETPEEYISALVSVFEEVRRVLRPDGTLWVNIGDSYCAPATSSCGKSSTLGGGKKTQAEAAKRPNKKPSGDIKQKDLIGIPWMLAFALRAAGWYLRQDIIWQKPNCMPESVKDRCTKSHEHIFLLSKSPKYYFDAYAIKEPVMGASSTGNVQTLEKQGGAVQLRNKRDVWSVSTSGYKGAHFAVFPEKLIEPCILAGAPNGGIVLDPFMGSGTTAATCIHTGRQYIGFEINAEYCDLARQRIASAKEPQQEVGV